MCVIDLGKIPNEPTVDIIDSEGNIVLTTDSDIAFLYVRKRIKDLKLKGWRVRCHSNGFETVIYSDGKIKDWEKGNFPGDSAFLLLKELV